MEVREEIMDNPFFKTLQNNYPKLYQDAEKNCWLICVPQTSVLADLEITKEVIDVHVVKPSPLYRGVYTVHNNTDWTCDIFENTILTEKGYPTKITATVLFEELFYNQDFKPFRVVCIDVPLFGGTSHRKHFRSKTEQEKISPLPSSKDLNKCMEYLSSFPENELVLRKIDAKIAEFHNTYLLVKGFESELSAKVNLIVDHAAEMLLCANIFYRKMRDNDRQFREISFIIESYVLQKLYAKVFLGLRLFFEAEDDHITKLISYHKNSPQAKSKFGVSVQFHGIPFTKAIAKLENLSECQTALQMVYLLEEVLEEGIVATIDANFVAHHGIGKESDDAITTDDLIPIISYVISQTSYKYYHSTFYFMENFIFTDITTTKLAFILINFRAALMYICEQIDDRPKTQLSPMPSRGTPLTTLMKSDMTRSSSLSSTLDASFTDQSLASGTQTTPRAISLSKISPTSSLKLSNLPKSSPKMVSQPTLTQSPQNKSNFQRAPEVILVNQSPQDDGLSYLKSLPKQ